MDSDHPYRNRAQNRGVGWSLSSLQWVFFCRRFLRISWLAEMFLVIAEKQGLSNRIITDSFGCLKINGNQFRDAALFHGDAEKPIHARHCHAVMRNHKESGVSLVTNITQKITESNHIRIIKRGIHLIKNANRRRIRQKDGKNYRQRG